MIKMQQIYRKLNFRKSLIIRNTVSYSRYSRACSNKPNRSNKAMTEEEKQQMLEMQTGLKNQEKMWNMLAPDRNLNHKQPIFWVLVAATLGLFIYNGMNEDGYNEKRENLWQNAKNDRASSKSSE